MYFAFSEEQLLFRDAVRDLLKKECTPAYVRSFWETESAPHDTIWPKLAEQGVAGLTVPEAQGGLGMQELDAVLLAEAAGETAYPGLFAETVIVGAPALNAAGNDESAAWLNGIASGELCCALSLDGEFCGQAQAANLFLLGDGDALYAATPEQVTLRPQTSVDRARHLCAVEWSANNCTQIGDQTALQLAIGRATVGAAAQMLGLAHAMLDLTVDYAKTRKQFGKPIGSFQAIKHHLASVLVDLAFARPMVYRAAYSLQHDDPERDVHVSMAKVYAGTAATKIAKTALQCHGAIGYTTEYDLHMWMKRAWVLEKLYGDVNWHQDRIADTILDPAPSRATI